MSGAKTHMVRSHRSKRSYKPVNKAMVNKAAQVRRKHRLNLRGLMSNVYGLLGR